MSRKRITIQVDDGLRDRLALLTQATGSSLQHLVEEALDQYVTAELSKDEVRAAAREVLARQSAALGVDG